MDNEVPTMSSSTPQHCELTASADTDTGSYDTPFTGVAVPVHNLQTLDEYLVTVENAETEQRQIQQQIQQQQQQLQQQQQETLELTTPTLPPSSGLIKCPVFCRTGCVVQHHPLLVAILNCADTEEEELMDMKLSMLRDVIHKFKQGPHKLQTDGLIPDVVTKYCLPMLHWACMLGRVGAAVWLVGHRYMLSTKRVPDDVICRENAGQTGVHKALESLQETCPRDAGRKFKQLLSVMEPALSVQDTNGNTPIHLCCQMLSTRMPRPEFYKECLQSMLQALLNARNLQEVAVVLNCQNKDGNTALHFLSHGSDWLPQLRLLRQHGASPAISNKQGVTARQIMESTPMSLAPPLSVVTMGNPGNVFTPQVSTVVEQPELSDPQTGSCQNIPEMNESLQSEEISYPGASQHVVTEFPPPTDSEESISVAMATEHINPVTMVTDSSNPACTVLSELIHSEETLPETMVIEANSIEANTVTMVIDQTNLETMKTEEQMQIIAAAGENTDDSLLPGETVPVAMTIEQPVQTAPEMMVTMATEEYLADSVTEEDLAITVAEHITTVPMGTLESDAVPIETQQNAPDVGTSADDTRHVPVNELTEPPAKKQKRSSSEQSTGSRTGSVASSVSISAVTADSVVEVQIDTHNMAVASESSTLESTREKTLPDPVKHTPLELYEAPSVEEVLVQQFVQDAVNTSPATGPVTESAPPSLGEYEKLLRDGKFNIAAWHLYAPHEKHRTVDRMEILRGMDSDTQLSVIEAVLQKHDEAARDLQLADKGINRLQQRYRETRQEQDALVSEILTIVESLGQLQREEAALNVDITELDAKGSEVGQTRDHLWERLRNCQEAINILKRLYREEKKHRLSSRN